MLLTQFETMALKWLAGYRETYCHFVGHLEQNKARFVSELYFLLGLLKLWQIGNLLVRDRFDINLAPSKGNR